MTPLHPLITAIPSHKITSIIAQAKDDERFAVIFIDIDDFKYINDTYGHETGDKVIQQTAKRLRMFGGGEQFLIGRFGGDEFMVIVRNFDNQKRLMDLCDGIRTALKNTMYIDNVAFGIAISMGVSLFPAHGVTKDELIKSTEIALYRAKGQGKDCIVFYDSSMNRLLSEKLISKIPLRKPIKTIVSYFSISRIMTHAPRKSQGVRRSFAGKTL